jgi:hypothetical protein
MALSLGVTAMFFGVVFIIVGWKGGGPHAMEANLGGMIKGKYLPENNPSNTTSTSSPAPVTSTTGGANSSGKK